MYNDMFFSGVLHSDLTFAFSEMIPMISLVTISPQTKLLQYYSSYSLCCILIPLAYLFYNWRFVPLSPLPIFLSLLCLAVFCNFCYDVFSFPLSSMYFWTSFETSSLPMDYVQVFQYFLVIFLLLISSLIPQQMEITFYTISTILNVLRFIL